MQPRLLICGSRKWTEVEPIRGAILATRPSVIIEGCAKGADALAEQIAAAMGIPILHFPANWECYGKSAGSLRNQQMLDEGQPTVVAAFPLPGSKGTWDMIRRSEKAGIPIFVHDLP